MKSLYKILLVSFILMSCRDVEPVQCQNQQANYISEISSFQLPDELYLCGEKLPLEIPEIRERAEREFYLLLQKPGQIMLYLKRAGRYFPMYEKLIRENNMPDDIKYLSVAESALFQARSAKDAIGLWQFMKATGLSMGLVINDNVDERRNPEKSTRAALKYLKRGYKGHRSWVMTLAGYNMGHTGVSNAMKRQYGTDYFDLFLNEETSRFVFRIAIIKEIMGNAKKYGFNLTDNDLYKPYTVKTVKWKSKINNLSDWAISQGTTYKYVKLLNPWLLKRKLNAPPKGKFWEIDIPQK